MPTIKLDSDEYYPFYYEDELGHTELDLTDEEYRFLTRSIQKFIRAQEMIYEKIKAAREATTSH